MPLHFNSFSNEMSSSQSDVGVLTTTLYILGGEKPIRFIKIAMIELKKISRSYGKHIVLDGLDVSFDKGTINTIIAPNGTGKTTLLSILSNVLLPDSGEIVYGPNLSREDIILLLPGEKNLYMKNTVYENIVFFGALAGVPLLKVKENIDKYRTIFPMYDDISEKAVESLSYGQKRLAALFSTVVVETKCVMVDEASEGLDYANVNALKKMLDTIKKECVVILASQNYEFAADVSDNLFYLKDGKIVEKKSKTTKEDLIKTYVELFELGDNKND